MHASGVRRSARTRAPTERAELTVTDATARRAAAHLRRFRRSHPAIDLADYLIAASAEEEGIELVTLNVKHFPMFPKLRPPWGSG